MAKKNADKPKQDKDEVPREDRIRMAVAAYHMALEVFTEALSGEIILPPSQRHFARIHGIDHTTLNRRLKRQKSRQEAAEHLQKLSAEEEEALAREVLQLHRWNFPPRIAKIRWMAEWLLRAEGDYEPLGLHWVEAFAKRHDPLKSFFSQLLDKERANSHNYERLSDWFSTFSRVTNADYTFDPHDVYNMDEKSFAMGLQGKQKVLGDKNLPAFRSQSGNTEWVSIIECVSADGRAIPPYVILKGKQLRPLLRSLMEPGGQIVMSDTGWTNNELGLQWLCEHFDMHTKEQQKGEYRLLLLDGHVSHINSTVIRFALERKIVLLCLPSHSTHLLQPLDVGVFLPLATVYKRKLTDFTDLGANYNVDKADFLRLFQEARHEAMTSANIKSAWRKAGLYPYKPQMVLQKISSPDERPVTPPEVTITNSQGASIHIAFTPQDAKQVDKLFEQVKASYELSVSTLEAITKISKVAKISMASYHVSQYTNKGLAQAAQNEEARRSRKQGDSHKGRVLNQGVIDKREKAIEDRRIENEFMESMSFFNKLTITAAKEGKAAQTLAQRKEQLDQKLYDKKLGDSMKLFAKIADVAKTKIKYGPPRKLIYTANPQLNDMAELQLNDRAENHIAKSQLNSTGKKKSKTPIDSAFPQHSQQNAPSATSTLPTLIASPIQLRQQQRTLPENDARELLSTVLVTSRSGRAIRPSRRARE